MARQPYVRDAEWGTLIKLYEYSLPGHRTHIRRKSGLLARLELLLAELALPIRLHEYRPGYGGHACSYETTLTGLSVRLDEGGRAEAETYRCTEGIIFTVNGQTHGYLTADFS